SLICDLAGQPVICCHLQSYDRLALAPLLQKVNMATQRFTRRQRDALNAYLFVLPWIVSLLVFTAYPVIASFYFAFTRYTVLTPPQFIGVENFTTMFTRDPLYWRAVWNTAYFTLFSVPLGLLVALLLALLLNTRSRGIGLYRTLYYLPGLMPTVATAL